MKMAPDTINYQAQDATPPIGSGIELLAPAMIAAIMGGILVAAAFVPYSLLIDIAGGLIGLVASGIGTIASCVEMWSGRRRRYTVLGVVLNTVGMACYLTYTVAMYHALTSPNFNPGG